MQSLNESHVNLQPILGGSSGLCDARASHEESVSPAETLGVGNERESSVLECGLEVDLRAGVEEMEVHLPKRERKCRICQCSPDRSLQETGSPMDLGCSCKGDLAAAHKQCAEAWFSIKGNKTCEICGSIASSVAGLQAIDLEQQNEANHRRMSHAAAASVPLGVTQTFWQDRRLLNIFLAIMVFAFVVSWLFRFKAPKL